MEDGKRSKHVYRIVVRVSRASFPTFLIIPSVCHTRAQSCELMTHDGRWPKQVGNSSFLGTIPRCSLHASQGSQVQGVPRRTTAYHAAFALVCLASTSSAFDRARASKATSVHAGNPMSARWLSPACMQKANSPAGANRLHPSPG